MQISESWQSLVHGPWSQSSTIFWVMSDLETIREVQYYLEFQNTFLSEERLKLMVMLAI